MIERIIINNYKSIRQADLRLAPLNILIGANGAGKSNFISFFQLVNQVYEGRLKQYSEKKTANNLLYRGLKHSKEISGLLDFENTNAYSFVLAPRDDESLIVSNEVDYWNNPYYSYDQTKNYNKWHWNRPVQPYREGATRRAQYLQQYLTSFKVYHFHDTSDTSAMKMSGPIDDNAYLREDASNLAAFLYLLQEREPLAFRRIEMVVRTIAPFFERFDLKPRQINPDQIKLEWTERESDMYLDAQNLSDGTLRFMALATLLLQPDPPRTILIDEPELGLHPFAIHKLAALLQKASGSSQIIVSTQSVELVNQFEPDDIVTVDRLDGQSIFRRLDKNDLQHWLDGFLLGDIWQKNIIGGQP